MENLPLVSIICTTYNQEAFIKDALEGFVMQKTNFPIEIIVHDDASTDRTSEIVKEYELQHPGLFANIYQTENQYSKGNNDITRIVFNAPRGKYIAICEGDDYWTDPLKLQKQVDFLEQNPDFGLVFTDADHLYEDTGKIIQAYDKTFRRKIPVGNVLEVFFHGNPYKTCTSLFKKEYVADFIAISEITSKHKFKMGDKILWFIIAGKSKVGYLPFPTGVYRIQLQSASHFHDFKKTILFGISNYKVSIYFAEFYKFPVIKNVLKYNYRKYVISKCITDGHYTHLRHFICHPYLILLILIKEKLVRKIYIN